MLEFSVDTEHDGCRIDQFLANRLELLSRSTVQKMIASGRVFLNGKAASKKDKLGVSDTVAVDESAIPVVSAAPLAQDIPLDVLYEDEYFAVINKPSGLVVHPGSGNLDGTVVNALLHRFGSVSSGFTEDRPGIVHRLDKDTSGALVIAKTNPAHSALAELFSGRQISKFYTGICIGALPADHEMIDLPLSRSQRDPLRRVVAKEGKEARTEYDLLKHKDGISLLRFVLHTGRTHQIRVHCSSKGFPIVQDDLYGGGKDRVLRLPPMERPFAYSIFKCFNRQALHAAELSFVHPFSGEDIRVTAPYPADFQCAIDAFGGL